MYNILIDNVNRSPDLPITRPILSVLKTAPVEPHLLPDVYQLPSVFHDSGGRAAVIAIPRNISRKAKIRLFLISSQRRAFTRVRCVRFEHAIPRLPQRLRAVRLSFAPALYFPPPLPPSSCTGVMIN